MVQNQKGHFNHRYSHQPLHTNELVVYEFKPLYAFVLALVADVMTLENNNPALKQKFSIPFLSNATFNSFDIPVPFLRNKHIGVKNLVFASAIAAGVAVGENVGYFAIPYKKELDEDDHRIRKKITLAMCIGCSVVFAGLAHWAFFDQDALDRVLQYMQTRMNGRSLRTENYKKGVNTESVLSNIVKTLLTAGTVNLSADGIANLLSF